MITSLLLVLVLAGISPARAEDDGGMIRKICLSSFAAAMASAGKTAPEGMADFSCDCFLEEVESGAGLDQAQTTCKERAADQFPLE